MLKFVFDTAKRNMLGAHAVICASTLSKRRGFDALIKAIVVITIYTYTYNNILFTFSLKNLQIIILFSFSDSIF